MPQKHTSNSASRGAKAAAPLPTWTFLGFLTALIAIVLICIISLRSLQVRTDIAAQVNVTHQSILELERILSALKDIETGERGFQLTRDEVQLAPYEAARSSLATRLEQLRAQEDRWPEQVGQIEQLALERVEVARETIEAVRAGQSGAELSERRIARAKPIMDRIRQLVAELTTRNQQSLNDSQGAWELAANISVVVVVTGSALLLVLLAAAAVLFSRDHRARERQIWLRAGQMGISRELQGVQHLEVIGQRVISFLARYLDAQVGAIYLTEADGRLRRFAGFASSGPSEPGQGDAPEVIRPGEGLVGQVARDQTPMLVTDLPENYLQVTSGLGRARTRQLVLTPSLSDGQVQSVIELGFFHPVHPADLELLEEVSTTVAVSVRSAKDRSRLEELLEETQRQSEELQTQQEELRVANEELEEQGHTLRASQARLETQQAELEQTNVSLEEQTQLLERQKAELTIAQEQLTAKAEELMRTNRYKSEFLANMSHELRTPLNSSLILAKILADNRDGNLTAEQVKFASNIYSAGNDLLLLINDILDLSKIEAGKIDIQVEPVDLSRMANTLTQTFNPISEEKNVPLRVTLEEGLPATIENDSQRLQQVLNNLLSNAFKFTAQGHVSLRIRQRDDGRIAFEVQDTGIGIAPEQQEVIFEAFRQADGTTNRKYGGTGLGLSISRDLARLLGGDIELVSAEGAGSTFTLVIPQRMEAPAAPPTSRAQAMASLVPPPREDDKRQTPPRSSATPAFPDDREHLDPDARVLLVVEDDPAFARILFDLAHDLKFQCLVAHEADEGVALALEHHPSAIVLDLALPDHSGLTVLDRLKRNPSTRHIPVQIVSAADHGQTAREMGAAGYIMKPVRREEVANALRKLEARFSRDIQTVLVVEDDPIQRESLEALLGSDSVRTVPVATASAALEALERSTFDCMVLDLSLPDASGYELLERMAKDDAYSFPPVIVYTGRSLSADEEQRLRRYSRSIIIKGAKSPERLLDEVTLFLHQVEAKLPLDRQRMLQIARNRESTFEGRNILVVEDDVRNIFALSRLLEHKGAKLRIARNGREALELLARDGAVDVVLMDIMMPEMDGYEAMREIRKRPEFKDLPIIALTAKAMRDDQQRSLEAGANDYVAKPIDVEKLLSLIRVWMPS